MIGQLGKPMVAPLHLQAAYGSPTSHQRECLPDEWNGDDDNCLQCKMVRPLSSM